MFCTKCGTQNNNGEKFCKNCGILLENNQNQQYSNTNGTDPNYVNKAVNPNMKKWAILSIIVPVIAIIWYIFIGLSSYLAILIAAAGFGFAKKGEMANKKLATIGKVANGTLTGLAIVMFILQLLKALAK